jgi:phytoene dehydrogenase-like protein
MRLGYFEGGFQALVERLTAVVQQKGGQIVLNCPVEKIEKVVRSHRDGRPSLW